MSFDGKVVLITGASSGIGADAARHFAKLGAKVSIVGRNEKRVNQVAEEIRKSGSPIPLTVVADVTKDAERIVKDTIKHFGKLDILVNNAGIANKDQADAIDIAKFDHIFNTNVRSVVILTQLCVPHLAQTKGNIVNVSSVAGLRPLSGLTSYCTSKAALDQFTKCSALDLASKGIRVNCINPAVIRTPIFESVGFSTEQAEQYVNSFKDVYPVGRPGEVSDTSAAIAFLADNKLASFLTGVSLSVDGGALVDGRLWVNVKSEK